MHARLSGVLEAIPQGIAFFESDERPGWINRPGAAILGLEPGPVTPEAFSESLRSLCTHISVSREAEREVWGVFSDPSVELRAWTCEISQPHPRTLAISTQPAHTHPNNPEPAHLEPTHIHSTGMQPADIRPTHSSSTGGRIWIFDDITGRRATEQSLEKTSLQLAEQEERWQLALLGTNDGIWDWNARTNEVFYSVRWKEMLGFSDSELPNTTKAWEDLIHPEDFARVQSELKGHLDGRKPLYVCEYRIRCKNGEYKWILARGKAILDSEGKPVRLVGAHADITERKQAEELLSHEASHDALTGCLNRRHFLAAMESASKRAESAETLSLCICDIDFFKRVNDTQGHRIGDEVLIRFARTLREGLRRQDVIGRMGGDEFYILFPNTTVREASLCADRIREKWAATSFTGKDGNDFTATASFGVVGWAGGIDVPYLIETADRALYRAKKTGRNRIRTAHAGATKENGGGDAGMETPTPNLDGLLRTAIAEKRLIRVNYKDKSRVVEPYDYGIHNGSLKLLGYQVGGSSSGKLPSWRWMEVNSISDIDVLDRKFSGNRLLPTGRYHAWDQLFMRAAAGKS